MKPKQRALVVGPDGAHDREWLGTRSRIPPCRVDGARAPRIFRARVIEDGAEPQRVRVRRGAPRGDGQEVEFEARREHPLDARAPR